MRRFSVILIILTLVSTLAFAGCDGDRSVVDPSGFARGQYGADDGNRQPYGASGGAPGGGRGVGRGGPANSTGRGTGGQVQAQYESAQDLTGLIDEIPPTDLSEEEQAGLLFMLEEEKLARDVYAALYETWNLPVFASISRSEEQHMAALSALLERYALEAPAAQAAGSFTIPALQTLYDDLVEQGSASLAEALRVGATIEDLDINDLARYIEESDNDDLRIIYQNLMKGSRNHLRSFVAQLERLDQSYSAQYIDEAYLERILQIVRETAPITVPEYEL